MTAYDDIIDRHNGRSIRFETSSVVFNVESHLNDLANRLGTDRPPVVLWNVVPSDVFSVLHAIYAQKLAQLAMLGFRCVVVIFDSYVRDQRDLGVGEYGQLRRHAAALEKRIRATGVPERQIEFVLESELRAGIGGDGQFSRGLTQLAYLVQQNAPAGSPRRHALKTLGSMFEMYYEWMIDADLILAGEADTDGTWKAVRLERANTKMFGQVYTPPLIGEFPMFPAADGTDMRADRRDSVSCLGDSADTIRDHFTTGALEFVATVHENLLSPLDDTVPVKFGEFVAQHGEAEARSRLAQYTIDYFQHIRQVAGA